MDFSLVAKMFDTLRVTPPSRLILLEAQTLSSAHVPPYPPDMPVLLTGIDSSELALQVKTVLLTTYPPDHLVQWVVEGKTKEERIDSISGDNVSASVCLYIPLDRVDVF